MVWFSLCETINFLGVWSQRWSGYCVDTRTARSRTRRTLKAPRNWKPQVWKVQTILKIKYILLRNLSICRCKNSVALSLELDLHREKVYEILSLVKKKSFSLAWIPAKALTGRSFLLRVRPTDLEQVQNVTEYYVLQMQWETISL